MSDGATERHDDPHASLRPPQRTGIEKVPRTLSTWTVTRPGDGGTLREIRTSAADGTSFVLNDLIGEGGVGEVWSAVQVSLDRTVAIKKVRADRSYLELEPDSPRRLFLDQRFHDEAMITAHLEHPNIVPVYDFGKDIDGTPMLAMKRVRGEPWDRILRSDFEVLNTAEFLARHLPVFIDMMQAVAFAHSRGVVHRDLKPSQVMIGEFGEVILIDWGLAILVDGAEAEHESGVLSPAADPSLPTPSTATNPSGTPALMAPEQTHDTAENISRRTDIYLLGGTLYYLLTGYYPHDSSNAQTSMKLAAESNVVPPAERSTHRSVPGELAALAMKALARHPADRIASVGEMIDRVSDYLTGNSARRESEDLAERVADRLARLSQFGLVVDLGGEAVDVRATDALDIDEIYTTLNECTNLLHRSLGLWFGNPRLAGLKDAVSAALALTAARSGDLGLARHMVPDIRDEGLRTRIGGVVRNHVQLRRNQAGTRRIAIASVAVLLFLLAGGAAKYAIDQRRSVHRIAHERDAADAARGLAERETHRADAARRDAEREQYFSSISLVESVLGDGRIAKARELLLERTPPALRDWEWGRLYASTSLETITLYRSDEEAEILHAVFSHDGRHIYTGDRRGRLCAWNPETGRLLRTSFPHTAGLWDISESPDGTKLLTSSFDRTGAILDATTLEVLHRLEGHERILRGGAISPDGRLAITTSRDRTTRIWNMETGERLPYDAPDSRGYEAEFLPDGSAFLVAEGSGVNLYDSTTAKPVSSAPAHPGNVLDIAVSPDGTRFATACSDRVARVFLVATMEQTLEIPNVTSWLHTADWSPDGAMIATGDNDGTCRVWNPETGEMLREIRTGHTIFKVSFSPDSRRLVTAADVSVQVWDVGQLPDAVGVHHVGPASSPRSEPGTVLRAFSAPLETSAWLGYDHRFRQGTDGDGRTVFEFGDETFAVDSYYTARSPDGRYRIETDNVSLRTVLVDATTGESLAVLSEDSIYHSEWSPGGVRFMTGSVGGDMTLWNAKTREPVGVLGESYPLPRDIQAKVPGAFRFSPDGSRVLVGRRNGVVEIFDAESGEWIRELSRNEGGIFAVAWSPDGRRAAAGGVGSRVRVWDTATGRTVSTLTGHKLQIHTIDFHPGGERILTGGSDDDVKLWETETGREISTVFSLSGDDFLVGTGFTADGSCALAVSSLGTVLLARALPWSGDMLPEVPEWSLEDRLALVNRRIKTGLDISPDDIAITVPEPPDTASSEPLAE